MKDLTQSIGRQTFGATPAVPGHHAEARGIYVCVHAELLHKELFTRTLLS
jgi:hypothetical protein